MPRLTAEFMRNFENFHFRLLANLMVNFYDWKWWKVLSCKFATFLTCTFTLFSAPRRCQSFKVWRRARRASLHRFTCESRRMYGVHNNFSFLSVDSTPVRACSTLSTLLIIFKATQAPSMPHNKRSLRQIVAHFSWLCRRYLYSPVLRPTHDALIITVGFIN